MLAQNKNNGQKQFLNPQIQKTEQILHEGYSKQESDNYFPEISRNNFSNQHQDESIFKGNKQLINKELFSPTNRLNENSQAQGPFYSNKKVLNQKKQSYFQESPSKSTLQQIPLYSQTHNKETYLEKNQNQNSSYLNSNGKTTNYSNNFIQEMTKNDHLTLKFIGTQLKKNLIQQHQNNLGGNDNYNNKREQSLYNQSSIKKPQESLIAQIQKSQISTALNSTISQFDKQKLFIKFGRQNNQWEEKILHVENEQNIDKNEFKNQIQIPSKIGGKMINVQQMLFDERIVDFNKLQGSKTNKIPFLLNSNASPKNNHNEDYNYITPMSLNSNQFQNSSRMSQFNSNSPSNLKFSSQLHQYSNSEGRSNGIQVKQIVQYNTKMRNELFNTNNLKSKRNTILVAQIGGSCLKKQFIEQKQKKYKKDFKSQHINFNFDQMLPFKDSDKIDQIQIKQPNYFQEQQQNLLNINSKLSLQKQIRPKLEKNESEEASQDKKANLSEENEGDIDFQSQFQQSHDQGGDLSPKYIQLTQENKKKLKQIEELYQDQWSTEKKENLIIIMKHLSPKCKHTKDPELLEQILYKYLKGQMTHTGIGVQCEQIQQQYEQLSKDFFVQNYQKSLSCNPNPLDNRENYLLDRDNEKTIKLIDNLIYYKQIMINQGLKEPEIQPVYINKSKVQTKNCNKVTFKTKNKIIDYDKMYKYTRAYQNQSSLCEFGKIGTNFIYKLYEKDKRYNIDENEKQRIDLNNIQNTKDCCEHGSGWDQLQKKKQELFSKTQDFRHQIQYSQKQSIDVEQQTKYLIQLVKQSEEPEFQRLKEILLNKNLSINIKFENLRQINPLIFMKEVKDQNFGSNKKEWDQNGEIQQIKDLNQILQRNSNTRSFKLPQNTEIEVDEIILEKFLNTLQSELLQKASEKNITSVNDNKSISLEFLTNKYNELKKQGYLKVEEYHTNLNETNQFYKETQQSTLKLSILSEQLIKNKFYLELKHQSQNPIGIKNAEVKFQNDLQGSLVNPIFQKISNGDLILQEYFLNSQIIQSFSNFIEEKTIEKSSEFDIYNLVIDDCHFCDQDFANFLKAIRMQEKIKTIIYSSNKFGLQSVKALRRLLEIDYPFNVTLETLHLNNLQADQSQILALLNMLEDFPILQRIKLQMINLNSQKITQSIQNQILLNPNLLELDLSFSQILIENLESITRELAVNVNQQLQYLNLSYINTEIPNSNPIKQKSVQQFMNNICKYLENSISLLHLDLSGMNLREKSIQILESIEKASLSKIRSVHLNDNDISSQTKQIIIDKISFNTQNMHKTKDLNIDEVHMSYLEQAVKKQSQIKQLVLALQQQKDDDNFYDENEQLIQNYVLKKIKLEQQKVQCNNNQKIRRKNNTMDTCVLTRKIGHKELIFNNNINCFQQPFTNQNREIKWDLDLGEQCIMTNQQQLAGQCYICQQHSYVQLFYSKKKMNKDYKRIVDNGIIEQLNKTYDFQNQIYKDGHPILISSMNNWVPTRLVDLLVYCQIIKASDPDPRYQYDHCISLRNTVPELFQSDKVLQQAYRQKHNIHDEEEIIPNIKIQQFISDQDIEQINQCNQNIEKALNRECFKAYSVMLGIKINNDINCQQIKICDDFTIHGWQEILKKPINLHKEDLIQINFPYDQVNELNQDQQDSIHVFAGYVNPGKHTNIIYIPEQKQFYQSRVIIKARKKEIQILKGDSEKIQCKLHLQTKQSVEEENLINAIDNKNFFFKNWFFDTRRNLNKIFENDFLHSNISFQAFRQDQSELSEKLKMLNNIKKNYFYLLQIYKMYLGKNYIGCQNKEISSMKKVQEFMKEVNLYNEQITNSDYFLNEIKKQQKDFPIFRSEFILCIYYQALLYYKSLQNGKINFDQFLEFIDTEIMQQIKTQFIDNYYHNKIAEFRREFIWRRQVNTDLMQNQEIIKVIYDHFKLKINNDDVQIYFTIQSAINMLQQANIDIQVDGGISHSDLCQRLFILSKQTIFNELQQFHQYQYLEFQEFIEFICRITYEIYHPRYGDDETKSIETRMVSEQIFKDKLFQTLKLYILPILTRQHSLKGKEPVLNEKKFLNRKQAQKRKNAKLAKQLQLLQEQQAAALLEESPSQIKEKNKIDTQTIVKRQEEKDEESPPLMKDKTITDEDELLIEYSDNDY